MVPRDVLQCLHLADELGVLEVDPLKVLKGVWGWNRWCDSFVLDDYDVYWGIAVITLSGVVKCRVLNEAWIFNVLLCGMGRAVIFR